MIQDTEFARRAQVLISRELRVDLDRVTPTARFREDLAADHIDVICCLLEIEDDLEVYFDEGGIDAIATVADLIALAKPAAAVAA